MSSLSWRGTRRFESPGVLGHELKVQRDVVLRSAWERELVEEGVSITSFDMALQSFYIVCSVLEANGGQEMLDGELSSLDAMEG